MKNIESIPLFMVRRDLENLNAPPKAEGFSFRYFRPGDEFVWAEIEAEANEFPGGKNALRHFRREFGGFSADLENRCIFLVSDADGRGVGTAIAWFGEVDGRPYGKLHWVAVKPEFQGRGLGRLVVGKALSILSGMHERAYLMTRTTKYVGIKIYLDYGFVPLMVHEECRRGWRLVQRLIKHPVLENVNWDEYPLSASCRLD